MYDPQVIESHRPLLRTMAAESMVLLKNNGILPLKKSCRIAVFGRHQIEFIKGGLGSADIFCGTAVNLLDALLQEEASDVLSIDHRIADAYRQHTDYLPTAEDMAKSAVDNDLALWIIGRNSTEGMDREAVPGDFYFDDQELKMLKLLTGYFCGRVVILLNVCGVISLAPVANDPGIAAILYCGLPGIAGGNAICDILTGKVSPSGRLPDTWCGKYEDYPSSQNQRASKFQVDYEEDIFVGYRWFESDLAEKNKVIYTFGHGLSYTAFDYRATRVEINENEITVEFSVVNTGNYPGKCSLGLWVRPDFVSKVYRASVELKDFAKTDQLKPNGSQIIKMNIPLAELAFFDELGTISPVGSWVIEAGSYIIALGGAADTALPVGKFVQPENRIISTPGLKLTRKIGRTLHPGEPPEIRNIVPDVPDRETNEVLEIASSFINYSLDEELQSSNDSENIDQQIHSLYDVAEDRITMEQFLDQLSDRELIGLCQAKFPNFPHGTAGIGNLPHLGVPNPQTADGPAGVRLAVATSCFPCENLLACSWDKNLLEQMGYSMGVEALNNNIDIMLAPGMNIHRDPLCGRNFEYYSEDPVLSGTLAGYMVRGLQSAGASATLKHFAVNNKEEYRFNCNSQVNERALREIYLKNFEIAVKIGSPNCIMSSYNLINGTKVSCCTNLLTGILRDEWHYDGVVMTDWRNDSHLWQELLAGNDAKMPFGYPEELDMALAKLGTLLPRSTVRKSAARILEMITKTQKFKNHDFGKYFNLSPQSPLIISAEELSEISCNITRLEDCKDIGGGKTIPDYAKIKEEKMFILFIV